jgi:cytochrome c-type biogenesis protein CcmH/NrfG
MSIALRSVDPARVLDQAIEALNSPGAALPLEDVERALKAAPTDARLWHVKALIHREQERRELAVPALRRAVELAPTEPLIAHGLARTLLEAGLPSVDAFARAMKLAPNNPEVVQGMVSALLAERRIDDAIAGLELALSRSPQWTEGHDTLARLLWTEGDADFVKSLDGALARFPQALDLWRALFNSLMHANDPDGVLKRVAQARATAGDNPLFDINEAIAHAELGHTEVADRLFEPYAEFPAGPVQVRRVRHLLRSGRIEAAVELIDRWLYAPEGFMFWPYASIAWRMSGDPRWEWLEGDDRFFGVYDIADRLPPLDQLADKLRQLHVFSGQPLEQSLRGGTQTDGHLFQHIDPLIVQLREAVRASVAEYVAQLPPIDAAHPLLSPARGKIAFSGAWSVRLQSKGYHANHVHPAGWVSSALYIVLPPDIGQDGAGILALGEAKAPNFPIDLQPLRTVEPKPGRLALFPSYTWHGTRPFGEGERMTVAFDVARLP